MALSLDDLHSLMDMLASQPAVRTQFNAILLADELQAVPQRLSKLDDTIQALADAQRRTELGMERLITAGERTDVRLVQLTAAQQRADERIERLTEAQERLTAAQQHTEEQLAQLTAAEQRTDERLAMLAEEVQKLTGWQRGEAGPRNGEAYERKILRRAPSLFSLGEGGSPEQVEIQQRLIRSLKTILTAGSLADEEDPNLANIIWWKGDDVAVVEVSIQVTDNDMMRAAQRAETLCRAGLHAHAIVIGEEWMAADTPDRAIARNVDWKVGDSLSEGFIAFRHLQE